MHFLRESLFVLVLMYVFLYYQSPLFTDYILLALVVLGIYLFLISNMSKKPILFFLVLSVAIPFISWWLLRLQLPEAASAYPKSSFLTSLFIFVPVAIGINAETRKILILCVTFVLSLLLMPWVSGNGWQEIQSGLSGNRVDFNLTNAQHTGMLLGVAILMLLVFFRPWVLECNKRPIRLALWLFSFGVIVTFFMFTQLRAGLLSLAVVTGILFIIWMKEANFKVRFLIIFALIFSMVAISFLPASKKVIDRFAKEWDTVVTLPYMNPQDVSTDNVGARFHLWRFAIEHALDRPLTGWDRRGDSFLLSNNDEIQRYTDRLYHFHNAYLSLWIAYGLLGFLFYLALILWLGKKVYNYYYNERVMPKDIFVFLCLFFLYFALINGFEEYIFYDSGIFILSIVIGILYSFELKKNST